MSKIPIDRSKKGILAFLATILIVLSLGGCETDEAKQRKKDEAERQFLQFLANLNAPDSAAVTLLSLKHNVPEEVTRSVLVAYRAERVTSLMGRIERESATSISLRDLIRELARNHEVEPRVVAELIYDYYFVRKETLW